MRLLRSHTNCMKVVVSIPDTIIAKAEQLAKQFGISRRDVYARALGEFIEQHTPDRAAQLDEFAAQAARQAFSQTDW